MATDSQRKIRFEYTKTGSYRSYHVDGAYGGVTPRGKISVDFYTEKFPTPTTTEHILAEDGTIGAETGRESTPAITRQIEAGIVLDMDAAVSLRNWLNGKIEELIDAKEKAGSQS